MLFKLCKTPLGETGCLGNFTLLTGCLSIQFFNSFFLSRALPISESVFYSQAFFTLHSLPRGAEDRHFKDVSPLTYLICLSPKDLYIVGLFILYSCLDSWRICSPWDSNFFHDKLTVLKVFCFIRSATKLDNWLWIKVLILTFACVR